MSDSLDRTLGDPNRTLSGRIINLPPMPREHGPITLAQFERRAEVAQARAIRAREDEQRRKELQCALWGGIYCGD